jgi:hypothetical protein
MSAAISINPALLSELAPCPSEWRGTAVSKEAGDVARGAREVNEAFEHSHALFGSKAEAIGELYAILHECSADNWDGRGAVAVSPRAVRTAEEFIRVLPQNVPLPDVTPEPDGSVGLDWSESSTRVFSVSFGPGPRLAYAWLDGTDRGHAVARFDGEAIPCRILSGIRAIATVS